MVILLIGNPREMMACLPGGKRVQDIRSPRVSHDRAENNHRKWPSMVCGLKCIQEKERECMVEVLPEEKIETIDRPLRQTDSVRIRRRCNDCGLEWESFHYVVACPLRELEATFLSEGWFMMSSEEPSKIRLMV